MMMRMRSWGKDRDVKTIEEQESILQFDQFDNDTAIEIGLMILEQSRRDGRTIAVDISSCGQQLFHAALDGTSPDVDQWLRKKKNTAYRFFCSTLQLQAKSREHPHPLETIFGLDPREFVSSGGGFPTHVRSAGVMGAIAVSGTSDLLEHEVMTTCLAPYLKKDGCPSLRDA